MKKIIFILFVLGFAMLASDAFAAKKNVRGICVKPNPVLVKKHWGDGKWRWGCAHNDKGKVVRSGRGDFKPQFKKKGYPFQCPAGYEKHVRAAIKKRTCQK
jgi:ssDNA-binding Zn-finger/Zn-ribbon topoisomerase 1